MLGPTLFIIFINDLPDIARCKCELYADDNKYMSPQTQYEILNNLLQKDIDDMVNWCSTWSMKINISKFKIMHLGKNNQRRKYFMEDVSTNEKITLETTEAEKDLGIIISANESHTTQVTSAIAKANRCLGRFRNTFKYFTSKVMKILYPVYIRPHIEFSSVVWNDLSIGDLSRLEKFQHKVTRFTSDIKSLDYNERIKFL